MPGDDRGRLDDEESVCPTRPSLRNRSPEGSVDRSQPRPRRLPVQDRELLPQREVLENQARPWAQERAERSKDRCHDGQHDASLAAGRGNVTAESALSFR